MFSVEKPKVFFKSSENMEEVDDNSVQLIVTSPPYGKIKDYGISAQIGYSDSFEEYFARLKRVWRECKRVLEPQCRMVINIGDQYLRTSEHGRYRILSIASRIINDCSDLGFDFLGDIIWQKISTTNTTGGCSLMGSIYYPRNGLLTFDYEHILIFKKHEGKGRKVELQRKELSKIPLNEWKKWYVGHWKFPGIVQKEHVAMFPEELPYRIIRMFSHVGDTVLDPFLGSGTTLKVAKALFRNGIGYEINEEYAPIIKNKVKQGVIGYFKDYQYLLYKIYQKSKKENVEFNFNSQKQKGIIVLKNLKDIEIILDYFSLMMEVSSEEMIRKELKSKIEENTIQNYIKEKEKWKDFKKYFIVINSDLADDKRINDLFREMINELKISKEIHIISMDQILLDNYRLENLFK